tara:strand:- start:60810 stop:62528 length:1719 start_codon:yes stop_codon:yes gene_type:complete
MKLFRKIAFVFIFAATCAGAQDTAPINAWPEVDRVDVRNLTAPIVERLTDEARARLALRKARETAAEIEALEAVQAQALIPEVDADFDPDVAPHAREYRTACASGNAKACIELAQLYRQGGFVWIDRDLGDTMLRLWCRRGELSACTSDVNFDDYAPIIPILTKGCIEKSAKACQRLSSVYSLGVNGVERDTALAAAMDDLARRYAEVACAQGHGDSCYLQFFFLNHWKKQSKETEARLTQILEAGCAAANSSSCEILASRYLGTRVPAKDVAKSNRLYDKACALGSYRACVKRNAPMPPNAAGILCAADGSVADCQSAMPLPHEYVAADWDEAQRLKARHRSGRSVFEAVLEPEYFLFHPQDHGHIRRSARVCAMGENLACRDLADAYASLAGRGLEWASWDGIMDRQTQREIFEHLCNAADPVGCWKYGYALYSDQHDSGVLAPPYVEVFQRACNMGQGNSCAKLAFHYELRHSRSDKVLAAEMQVKYARHACDLDNHDGCSTLAGYLSRDPLLYGPANLRACLEGEPNGCWILAQEYDRGRDGFRKDRSLAKMLRETGDALAEQYHSKN